jgi:hypothetical protein
MKYLVFLLILCFYTEGSLLAQVPTVLDRELTADSTAVEENAIEEEAATVRRPRVSPYAAAQEKYNQEAINQRDIDAEKWRKATAGIDYSDDKMKKPEPEKPTNSRSSDSSGAGVAILAGAFLMFLKWFFIIGGICLIAFLIYRFVGEGNVFGTKSRKIAVNSEEIDLENIEENLEKAELDPIISKAIAARNFPLAIRLYYLAILKELTLAGAIKWKKDKTNRIYVQEMQPHPLMENFRQVTTIFERVWYGDTPLDEVGFGQIQPSFQGLLDKTRVSVSIKN